MCNNITMLWKLGNRCKSQIFNHTGSIHVIQHHAIKYNTIINIAFIEMPPILMANYESDTHIIIINNINTCCHQ